MSRGERGDFGGGSACGARAERKGAGERETRENVAEEREGEHEEESGRWLFKQEMDGCD